MHAVIVTCYSACSLSTCVSKPGRVPQVGDQEYKLQLLHLHLILQQAKTRSPTCCVLARLSEDEVSATGMHCPALEKVGGMVRMESESVKSASSSD
jgi:hypothetical protein